MPTGYTAKLHDGDTQTFPEFALDCAHAFGALILLRDSGMDSPIPEFTPDTGYHDKALATAEADLAELRAMPLDEAGRRARADFDRVRAQREEAAHGRVAMKERYEAMLAQVAQWTPPTPEHVGLKEFMTSQLNESIRFDCSDIGWPEYPLLSPHEWKADRIAKAERDIAYHTERRAEEIERTNERNAWVRALRASLGAGQDESGSE